MICCLRFVNGSMSVGVVGGGSALWLVIVGLFWDWDGGSWRTGRLLDDGGMVSLSYPFPFPFPFPFPIPFPCMFGEYEVDVDVDVDDKYARVN